MKRSVRGRSRTLFDVACRNEKCDFYRRKKAGNFVRASQSRLKDGRVMIVLRCDCGVHRRVRPNLTQGLHLYNPPPDTALLRLAAAVRATPQERFLLALGRPLRRPPQVDASFGFDLARIVRGESISDVARSNCQETLATEEYAAYDSDGMIKGIPSPYEQSGGIKAWLKLYPLYLLHQEKMLRSMPAPKMRVHWGRYKNTVRTLRRWVKKALGDMESTMQALEPHLRRYTLTRGEYKRACSALEIRYVGSNYRKIVSASSSSLTTERVIRALGHALEASKARKRR